MIHNQWIFGLIVLTIAFSSVQSSHAGKGNGSHGGSVLVCGEGSSQSVRLAEFQEVDTLPYLSSKVTLPSSGLSVDEYLNSAIVRLKNADHGLGGEIEAAVQFIRSKAEPIPSDYDWGESGDVNHYPIPEGCTLRTAVYYLSAKNIIGASHGNVPVISDVVQYRSDLLSKLSHLDQAGLWLHEGVFKVIRDRSGELGTLSTRRVVQLAFSEKEQPKLLIGLLWKSVSSLDLPVIFREAPKGWSKDWWLTLKGSGERAERLPPKDPIPGLEFWHGYLLTPSASLSQLYHGLKDGDKLDSSFRLMRYCKESEVKDRKNKVCRSKGDSGVVFQERFYFTFRWEKVSNGVFRQKVYIYLVPVGYLEELNRFELGVGNA